MALGREREWFKEVAKGADHTPDPTRWHACTELFKRAAEALCAGNLGRGAVLLEQAAAEEEAAFESVPGMVETDLDRDEVAVEAPDATFLVNDEAGCPGCDRPDELKIAERILAVQPTFKATPPLARPRRWWEEEGLEEEEEEDEDAE
jgi:hypothetical protein